MSPWSYVRGPDAPILDKTIGQMLGEAAVRFPDRDAPISCHQDVRMSWREFDREIDRTARGLAGLGLAPEDRLGVWYLAARSWSPS
jgi:fatty-acyl-CoA synthase